MKVLQFNTHFLPLSATPRGGGKLILLPPFRILDRVTLSAAFILGTGKGTQSSWCKDLFSECSADLETLGLREEEASPLCSRSLKFSLQAIWVSWLLGIMHEPLVNIGPYFCYHRVHKRWEQFDSSISYHASVVSKNHRSSVPESFYWLSSPKFPSL